jgi:hypothetical protein
MLYDENLVKTKAFKEQLEQHARLLATQGERSKRLQDRQGNKISNKAPTKNNWLQAIFRKKPYPHAGSSQGR